MPETRDIPVSKQARALIFDCDGTLADSMPLHWKAWEEMLAEYGAPFHFPFLDARKGMPVAQIVAEYNLTFGTDMDPGQFAQRKEDRVLHLLERVAPIEPVIRVVNACHGKMPMAVVSGGTRQAVSVTLKALNLDHLMTAVLTADDGLPAKSDPAIFLAAARSMGVAPETCQVFEDGDLGLEGARRAGMTATDIRPFMA